MHGVPEGTVRSIQQPKSKRAQLIETVRLHLSKQENKEAVEALKGATGKLSEDPEVLFLQALAYERTQQTERAIQAATKSARLVKLADPMMVLARCHRKQGNTEEALKWCDKIEQVQPNNPNLVYIRAGALEEGGRFKEAEEVLAPAVEQHTERGEELPLGLKVEWSKVLVQKKAYEESIELIDDVLSSDGLPDPLRNQQLHLKAKACDRSKDYASAWDAAERANEIGRVEYDPEVHAEQVDALIENWSRERMEKFPQSTCDSEIPVFVAGMPRSGTSLIDQIIDAHPKAAGVGELATLETFARQLSMAYDPELEPPECFGKMDAYKWSKAAKDYVREITRRAPEGAERIVNKALGNNKLVGLFAKLFPNTRVIHAIRDPRDVAISCFMGGFNNNLHAWTTHVHWVATSWALSDKMMRHWKDSLDIPILDVHYERLVADPENEFPRLIEFLGLEWDDRCYEFHKSKRTVRTLSYDQVNRPLYTSSSGRHANYAEFIEGIEFPEYDPWAEG